MSSAPSRQAERAPTRPATIAAELRIALMRTVRRLRAEKSNTDITDGQYSVLAVLDRHGPMTAAELARHEKIQPPSITRTVAALESRGLVTRTDHPDDGRQLLLALSPAGVDEVKETRRRRDAWLARQLAALDPDERAILAQAAQILRRVVDA